MLAKFSVWVSERLLEIFLGSIISILIFGEIGPPLAGNLIDEIYISSIAVMVFYILSGYCITSFLFGFIFRINVALWHASVLSLVFSIHLVIFSILDNSGNLLSINLLFLSIISVFLINFSGGVLLSVIDNSKKTSKL